eukprot:1697354-Pleurochrysis_carterae.AAC.1
MPILPFGCRAFAVKPRVAFNKTRMEPRAWVGINLGRSLTSPGAYSVYVPSVPRVVLTAEVYFDENTYLWRPVSPVHAAPVAAIPAATVADQPPGLPSATPPVGTSSRVHEMPRDIADAQQPTHNSRTVLLLFSGPFKRPDGISAFLRQAGLEVEMIDNHPEHGGGGRTARSPARLCVRAVAGTLHGESLRACRRVAPLLYVFCEQVLLRERARWRASTRTRSRERHKTCKRAPFASTQT